MQQIELQTEPIPESDEALPSRRIPLETTVILKFAHFGGFFVECSANISQTGIFIKTDEPRKPGSVFIFEIWLGEEFRLVHGLGEVVWVREADGGPEHPAGMGVRYLKIDETSQAVIERVIQEHVQRGGRVFDLMAGVKGASTADPTDSSVVARPRRWLVWVALAMAAVALILVLARDHLSF